MNNNNLPLIAHGTNTDEEKIHAKYGSISKDFVVEIGVLEGYTSKILLNSVPKGCYVIGIDPIIPDSMNPNLVGNRQKIWQIELEYSNYQFNNDYSYNIVKVWENNCIDYCFIDGSHYYEDVRQDFEQWLPKVKIGGFIGLHDSCMYMSGGQPFWQGPSKLAVELIADTEKRVNYVESSHALTIFQRI